MADIWTSPEEIREAIRLARAEARQVIRQHAQRLPDQAERFRTLEENLFEFGFGLIEVRELGGRKFRKLFEMTPGQYLAERRVRTVERILELVSYGMPIGRAAMAGGLFTYGTCRRAFENVNGELPVVICRPVCLRLRFDELTWHRARHGELSEDNVAALLRRLRRLYPGLLDGRLPAALALPPGLRGRRLPRPGGISDDEAKMAVELASAAARRRILAAAVGLQQQSVVKVLEVVAADLLDKELKGKTCRERAKVGDTSISAKVQFFLGDTLPETIERERIEASLALVVDRRFKLDEVARELGLCKRAFTDAFRRRTGAYPQEVRDTAAADSHLAAYRLWLGAEGGKLAPPRVLEIAGYLRGLQPRVVERPEAPVLAVRRDVDARKAGTVLRLERAVERGHEDPRDPDDFDDFMETHPRYSVERWYAHWVRDRLRRPQPPDAWAEWKWANRQLAAVLELPPEERPERVRREKAYQTDAFLWLLIDCVGVRLFHDAGESEHFADLAVAVAEARWEGDPSPAAKELLALARALKANALRRRNELDEASERFAVALKMLDKASDPWIVGRVQSLFASLLRRKGEERQTSRALLFASSRFKEAKDELERLRCLVDMSSGRFAKGRDPSQLLTLCIAALRRYPFAADLLSTAHLNRIVSCIFLTDRLTGQHLARIKEYRTAMPPAGSAFAAAQYHHVDGLIAALEGQPEVAAGILEKTTYWYEERDLLGDAAVSHLQYSWAALAFDGVAATRAAETAYSYMERTGFRSQGLHRVALKIYQDAKTGELRRSLLRRGILLSVCPGIEARLESEAEPF